MAITPGVTTPQQVNPMVQLEALRRRANLGDSTAAVPSQAPSLTSAPTPAQPTMQGGASGNSSDGTITGMKQQKGEAQKLGDALVWRLKKLTERGE